MRPTPRARSLAGFAVIPLVWGYNWIVLKKGLAFAGPLAFSAWRFGLASACLFAALALWRRPIRIHRLGAAAWVGLFQVTGNFGFAMWALDVGSAGRSVVLAYTMPFWVVLLARPLAGERPTRIQWSATALACAGVVCVFAASAGSLTATVLGTLSGLSWAVGALIARRLLADGAVDALALNAWQMLFGALAFVALALAFPGRGVTWSGPFVFALAYTVLLGTALAWMLWFLLLERLTAALASLAVLATPLLSLLFSAIELGERPGRLELAGMALILAGLVVVGPLAMREAQASPRNITPGE